MAAIAPTTVLTTTLATALPWLYFSRKSYLNNPQNPRRVLHAFINVCLLAHTLLLLRMIFLRAPFNLFRQLDAPLNVPTDTLRAMLLRDSPDGELPRHLAELVKKLGSFNGRALYIRFGHNALATCEYCHSFDDYALFSLAPIFLAYVFEMAVIGLTTIKHSHREPLRTFALGAVACAGIAEAYLLLTTTIVIPPLESNETPVMWYDTLTVLRQIFFLLLPLLISSPLPLYLPAFISPFRRVPSPTHPGQTVVEPVAANPSKLLQETIGTLQNALTRLRLLKYTHAALMRTPTLRQAADGYWEVEQREGEIIRKDDEVMRVARGVGLGFDPISSEREGGIQRVQPQAQLRISAKMAVEALANGYVPSTNWVGHDAPPQS